MVATIRLQGGQVQPHSQHNNPTKYPNNPKISKATPPMSQGKVLLDWPLGKSQVRLLPATRGKSKYTGPYRKVKLDFSLHAARGKSN